MKNTTNGYARLNTTRFNAALKLIVGNMTNNANFPMLQPAVQTLAAEATIFDELVIRATNKDVQVVLKRNASRAYITSLLYSLGIEISAVAKGNIEMLASSGYQYTQDRRSTPNLEKPDAPVVKLGINLGELICKTKWQAGARSVNYYIITESALNVATRDATAMWTIKSSNKAKYTFSGLASGQRYYIKVGLVGVRNQEVISDAVSFIPQ